MTSEWEEQVADEQKPFTLRNARAYLDGYGYPTLIYQVAGTKSEFCFMDKHNPDIRYKKDGTFGEDNPLFNLVEEMTQTTFSGISISDTFFDLFTGKVLTKMHNSGTYDTRTKKPFVKLNSERVIFVHPNLRA
jgi:hypothetical protein